MFALAENLGMTVRRLKRELDSREISEWRAYFRVKNELEDKRRSENQPTNKHQISEQIKAAFGPLVTRVVTNGNRN